VADTTFEYKAMRQLFMLSAIVLLTSGCALPDPNLDRCASTVKLAMGEKE
jgi:hypothetical protein